MKFTKEKTNITKGIAICLMFAHHLYAFNERLLNGNNYIPLIPSLNAEIQIGSFGKICVSIFLFLSGYGMFLGQLRSKENALHYSLKKLKEFYFTYWLYFLVFVPIGILYFQEVTIWKSNQIRYLLEPRIFLANFAGLSSTYNEEWWFVWPFAMILLFLFPLYSLLADKNIALVAFASLILFSLSYEIDGGSHFNFIYWQTSFALGIICAKLNFFSSPTIQSFDKVGSTWVFAWFLLLFVMKLKVGESRYDFLIVPFVVYFSCRTAEILRLSKLLAYLGEYSFPLWLTHSFFCYYYFQDIIYYPKWSPLIFILLTGTSLLSVLGVEFSFSFLLRVRYLPGACTGWIEKPWLYLKNIYRR